MWVTGLTSAVSPSPRLHLIVAGPDAPVVLVLVNVVLFPGQIAVSLVVKLTVGLA